MKKISYLLIIFVSLFIFSCTSYKKSVYVREAENNGEYQPLNTQDNYKLKINDILFIEINSLNENINTTFNLKASNSISYNEQYLYLRSYSINENGIITLPVVGEINVEGLTVYEASELIQKKVNIYLNDANIIVKLVSFKISILGEVSSPGTFTVYQNKMNIFEALSMAGDISDYGNIKQILLIRTNSNKTKTFRIDLTDKNLLTLEQFILQPNDIIYVEPVKAKVFRQNAPNLSVALSTITTLVLVLNFILK